MLGTWLQDNKTKNWSEGLKFVQFMKNQASHHGIKCSHRKAMFGSKPKIVCNTLNAYSSKIKNGRRFRKSLEHN